MRLTSLFLSLCAVVALAATVGCGNKERDASIKEMNKGVVAAQTQSYSTAERHLKRATSLYPANYEAWYNLGAVYSKQKLWKKAADAFAQAVKYKDDDAMYHYGLGHALFKSKQLSTAQTHLEKAVKLNKRLYKAWEDLGKIYIASDKPKQAAEAWTRSATLNPLWGKPFIDLGGLYYQWDMLKQAISVLDQGKINAKDPKDLSKIYYRLGLTYAKQHNWDKAIAAYSKALQIRSSNVDAELGRGFAYANKGDKKKAQKDLEAFVKSGGGGNAFNIQAANDRLMRLASQ